MLLAEIGRIRADAERLQVESERRQDVRGALRAIHENDLAAFVKKAWTIIHPTRRLVWSWHYDLLCEYLTAVKERKLTRLIVNVPPPTATSTIATICFPCWVWASDPSHNFLCASYSLDLSTDHSIMHLIALDGRLSIPLRPPKGNQPRSQELLPWTGGQSSKC